MCVQAEIAAPGTADSFLRAAHVSRTRRAHQITATTLHILQRRAYTRHCMTDFDDAEDLPEFEDWCHGRAKDTPPPLSVLGNCAGTRYAGTDLVRSLLQASFAMYLAALTELVPWFHALDHTHYARWIPVHLRDMAALSMKHPCVAREFGAGNFTVRKTKNVFSSIPIDQAHEPNNALIKGDGGSIGLTDSPAALNDCRARSCQGHRRVPRWPPTLGEARGHTSS